MQPRHRPRCWYYPQTWSEATCVMSSQSQYVLSVCSMCVALENLTAEQGWPWRDAMSRRGPDPLLARYSDGQHLNQNLQRLDQGLGKMITRPIFSFRGSHKLHFLAALHLARILAFIVLNEMGGESANSRPRPCSLPFSGVGVASMALSHGQASGWGSPRPRMTTWSRDLSLTQKVLWHIFVWSTKICGLVTTDLDFVRLN